MKKILSATGVACSFFLSFFLSATFISCEQDESVIDLAQEEVVPDYESLYSARDWFFSQTGGDVLMEFKSQTKSTGGAKQTLPLLGDWESGLTRRIEHIRNVEVPVYSVEDEEAYAKALNGMGDLKSGQSAPNDESLPSRTRFVVQTNEETGTTRGFMMTVIPDEEYLASGGSIDSIDYYSRGTDFSGLIVFNHLDGSFANAWMYEEGEIVRSYQKKRKNKHKLKVNTRPETIKVEYCNSIYSSAGGRTYYLGRHCWSCTYVVSSYKVDDYSNSPSSNLGGGSSANSSNWGGDSNVGGYMNIVQTNSQTPLTDNISKTSNLDQVQTNLLEKALNELTNLCSDNYIYNDLVAQGKKFNFKMNSSLVGLAGYDATTKTFSFRNNDAISSGKLKEEFFHAFQDAFYTGGISQYYNASGHVNIEFEAKLYKDISSPYCCQAFHESTAPQNIKDDYEKWIRTLRTSQNFVISPISYQKWLNLFNQYTTSYSSPTSNSLNYPHAIDHIINMSNCF